MRTATIALCILFLACTLVGAADSTKEHTVTVTGSGDVSLKPDKCYVTLYVKGDGILMVDAVKQADETVGKVEEAIREKGDVVKSIEVKEISLGEKQNRYWSGNQAEEPPRPEVIKRLRIEIEPAPALTHDIIDAAIRAGATMKIQSSVHYPGKVDSVVVYGLSDSEAAEKEAREKALEDAKTKAAEMAALVEKKIGTVTSIGCSSSRSHTYYPNQKDDFPIKYVDTNPDEIEISHSVSVTFELVGE